jgi:nitroreductase/NAD-dependent dihydropyrimidine dehydrogenase PreA subunit
LELTVNTVIDNEKCIGCGLCIKVCPYETISMVEGKARVTGEISLNCGHCMAACPVGAINVTSLQELTVRTFTMNDSWLKHGESDTSDLVHFMASLRSCRNYSEEPVAKDILEDLVMIGTTAPSGSNSQEWTFTILPDRKQVEILGEYTISYFRKVNKLAGNTLLRTTLRLLGQRKLEDYYSRYYKRIEKRIAAWDSSGTDFVFYGAPSIIMVGATPKSRCPKEDALLAAHNIRLGAHSMGLGSCLIGFAVQAVNSERSIPGKLGLPPHETIHAVIALGWPEENYVKIIARKKISPRYLNF